MTQIAALTRDERLLEMLRASELKTVSISEADLATFARGSNAPAAIVVDLRGSATLPAGLADLKRQHPDAGVVLVLSALEPKLMLEAMRAGVNECIAEPLTGQAVDEAVRRVIVGGKPETTGQTIAFVGAKGGVGTTTLAVNTAAALSRVGEGAALLIDLHVVHGDSSLFFAAEPRFSVLDALENVHRVDESFFNGLVEKTNAGVHLLASSTRTLHGPIPQDRIRALLDFASRKYRFTVLDVPRSDFATLDALDPVTTILVVTSQEVPALRNAAQTAETLRQRYGAQRVRVIVNRFDKSSVLGTAEIDRVSGEPVTHLIPSDYRVAVEAVNTGRPIVMEKDAKLAAALRSFARDIAGIKQRKAAEESGGVLARLAWRRA